MSISGLLKMIEEEKFINYTLNYNKEIKKHKYWISVAGNKKSNFILDPVFVLKTWDIDLVIHCYKKLITTSKSKIYFNVLGEAFPKNILDDITKISRILSSEKNISEKHIFFVSGAENVKENVKHFYHAVKKYNWFNFSLILNNTYEKAASELVLHNDLFYEKFKNLNHNKNKIFLCFNRTPREHRCALLAELYKNNLIEKSFVSFHNCPPNIFDKFKIQEFSLIENFFSKSQNTYLKILEENLPNLPITLNLNSDNLNPHNILDDFEYFKNSHLSIVTESKFFVDEVYDDLNWFDVTTDGYFFTEKTWKPILARHPFILMGRPGSLEILKRKGYCSFSPYIDESYDMIQNDNDRFDAIISELVRLSRLNSRDWEYFVDKTTPLVEINYQNLKNYYRGL